MEAAEKFNVGNYLSVSFLGNTNKKIVLYKNDSVIKISKADDIVESKRKKYL